MHVWRQKPAVRFIFIVLGAFAAGTGASFAEACFPHCDYTHYYGPFDFTYRQPDLFGHPLCGPQGDCFPHLAYTTSLLPAGAPQKRITVRFPRVTAAPRQP